MCCLCFLFSTFLIFLSAPPQLTAPANVTATEGRSLEVILPFGIHCYPAPYSVLYAYDGTPLLVGTRIVAHENGTLMIRNPTRTDAGHYMLNVTNSRGSDSAIIILNILCKKLCVYNNAKCTTKSHCADPPELTPPTESLVIQYNKSALILCNTHMVITGRDRER